MKISVTVQFHNELEFLPGWFDDASKYADEIICASHNPVDGSLEYVQEKAKTSPIPIKILHFPEDTIYRYGFCYMKNKTAEQATGDWIVSLDADEEMEMTKDSFMPFTNGKHIAISTHTMHIGDAKPEWSLSDKATIKKEAPWIFQKHWRIYRNNIGTKWCGIIHEELRQTSGLHVSLGCKPSPIKMYHYGALHNPIKRVFKDGLYAELLLRIVENPELRDGTNKWWYTEYYEKNKEKLLVERDGYRAWRKANNLEIL